MKVYVVGLGPGNSNEMTGRAKEALENCDVIAGYKVYIDLIKDEFGHKEMLSTGMTKEVDRCKMAIECALTGKTVAMVSSGDSGVYGMASVIYEVAQAYPEIEIEVVSGITAACSGAAVLGAPLTHDFAVISLSDLLTPLDKIHKRIACAADADFVICLYNPSSKKRSHYLKDACEIILRYQAPETQCGIVRQIGREGESYELMTLEQLKDTQVDMFTTVFIGNTQTTIMGGKLVTPRGYSDKYEI